MRKLATIREIAEIKPIPDADRIEVARIDGWEVVVSKKDNFHVGDRVVYVEIDSKMPETPEYEFLKSRKYVVKTIVMRGQVSQGLVMPLSILPVGEYKLGQDVTDVLGIIKYDPQLEEENAVFEENRKKTRNPVVKFLMRYAWFRKIYLKKNTHTEFPNFIKKTDEERIQNMPELYERLKNERTNLIVTEKVDGCSGTYFLHKIPRKFGKAKYEFGVCSRNRRLPQPDKSYYWKIANKYKIRSVLEKLIDDEDYIVLQGEITGAKIQGNKYHEKDCQLWAFNLITPSKKYNTIEMQDILIKHGIHTVPIVEIGYNVKGDIQDIVKYVKGKSQIVDREREGCVFRNTDKNISFKCINPNFLIKNNE